MIFSMNRAKAIQKNVLCLGMLLSVAVAIWAPGEACAQYAPASPPAAYIATTQPEYFDGRPVYWWHHYWYYRDGPRWNFYNDEPLTLTGRRANWNNRSRYHYYR